MTLRRAYVNVTGSVFCRRSGLSQEKMTGNMLASSWGTESDNTKWKRIYHNAQSLIFLFTKIFFILNSSENNSLILHLLVESEN